MRISLQPSICAASIKSLGTLRINWRIIKTPKAPTSGMTSAMYVLSRCHWRIIT